MPPYTPSPENLAARTWYQDAKLGMFIHWGPSSVLQDGEWVMNNRGIRAAEYESLVPLFNPTRFNATAWVRAAKDAGMQYITLITKHHDGIALWDSKVSDYTIVKRSPFARDVVKELADACAKEGHQALLLLLAAGLAPSRLLSARVDRATRQVVRSPATSRAIWTTWMRS